jgi:hypothetical protein
MDNAQWQDPVALSQTVPPGDPCQCPDCTQPLQAFIPGFQIISPNEDKLLKASLAKTTRASVHDLLSIYNNLFTSLYSRSTYYVKKGTLSKVDVDPVAADLEADVLNCLRSTVERLQEIVNNKDLWINSANPSGV